MPHAKEQPMPHAADWRESIPALDYVYMFQGTLYCEDCGQTIQDKIRKNGKAPEDEDDENSFDSDDFPKGPFGDGGGEADSPHHCDSNEMCLNAIKLPCRSKIGAWLGNSLTHEGSEWLSESIKKSIFENEHSLQVNRLWSFKYADSISKFDSVEPVTGARLSKPLIQKFIAAIGELHPSLVNQIWNDQNSLYGFSTQKKVPHWNQPTALIAWKSDLLSDGSLDLLKKVELPASEAKERPTQDILYEMKDEGAWN